VVVKIATSQDGSNSYDGNEQYLRTDHDGFVSPSST